LERNFERAAFSSFRRVSLNFSHFPHFLAFVPCVSTFFYLLPADASEKSASSAPRSTLDVKIGKESETGAAFGDVADVYRRPNAIFSLSHFFTRQHFYRSSLNSSRRRKGAVVWTRC